MKIVYFSLVNLTVFFSFITVENRPAIADPCIIMSERKGLEYLSPYKYPKDIVEQRSKARREFIDHCKAKCKTTYKQPVKPKKYSEWYLYDKESQCSDSWIRVVTRRGSNVYVETTSTSRWKSRSDDTSYKPFYMQWAFNCDRWEWYVDKEKRWDLIKPYTGIDTMATLSCNEKNLEAFRKSTDL